MDAVKNREKHAPIIGKGVVASQKGVWMITLSKVAFPSSVSGPQAHPRPRPGQLHRPQPPPMRHQGTGEAFCSSVIRRACCNGSPKYVGKKKRIGLFTKEIACGLPLFRTCISDNLSLSLSLSPCWEPFFCQRGKKSTRNRHLLF